jgi:hypothetical protein
MQYIFNTSGVVKSVADPYPGVTAVMDFDDSVVDGILEIDVRTGRDLSLQICNYKL